MKRTILLVDDEPDNLAPMKYLLEEEYRVLTAQSGEHALRLLAEDPAEIVIADQRMPGMTGAELLNEVRARHPEAVRLILTAFSDFDAMLAAINEGRVYRYIIKPWDDEDMRLTIRQALAWKDLQLQHGQLAAELVEMNRILAERNRELEQAHETIVKQEKLAAVGHFAAEMVHEMNNHLMVVMGLTQSIAATGKTEPTDYSDILQQLRTLRAIISDIRDFALGATGAFKPVRIDPVAHVRDLVRVCSHHPDFQDRSMRVEADEVGEWMLDERQIKHVLLNLLKNAAKASDAGQEIVVRILASPEELRIEVIDRGPGIPDERKEQVWEPFVTGWERNGTGLGLCVAKHATEQHDGSVVCENTPGGGATFTVRIPRSVPPARPSK